MCPANLTVQSLDGNATPVIYEPPSLIGGEPPIITTCVPKSGMDLFLLGDSTVVCTATDAVRRTGSCSFVVTVVVPPKLSATKFMAFGNSITEGKTASGGIQNTYPVNLQALLTSRYTAQAITVVNKGMGGESAFDGADRLPFELDAVRPEVLLLEEGVNDIGDEGDISAMIDALRVMVRQARDRGVIVFLATFPPQREGGSRAYSVALIPEVNAQIRALAQSEGATLVDLYTGFGGSPDPYIDVDGLHPTEAGYQKMAQLFFDAIKAHLEISPTVGPVGLVRNMPPPSMPFATLR